MPGSSGMDEGRGPCCFGIARPALECQAVWLFRAHQERLPHERPLARTVAREGRQARREVHSLVADLPLLVDAAVRLEDAPYAKHANPLFECDNLVGRIADDIELYLSQRLVRDACHFERAYLGTAGVHEPDALDLLVVIVPDGVQAEQPVHAGLECLLVRRWLLVRLEVPDGLCCRSR